LLSVYGGWGGLLLGGILVALGLPALQLLAALVTYWRMGGRKDESHQLTQVAKIALGTVVGAVPGALVMVCLYCAFGGEFPDSLVLAGLLLSMIALSLGGPVS